MTLLRVLLIILAVGVAWGGTATAAGEQLCWPDRDRLASDMREAGELIRQGFEKMLGSLDTALRAMPRYELPTVDENGNIIIRRKPPEMPEPGRDGQGRTI
jgi:hypothetical protein